MTTTPLRVFLRLQLFLITKGITRQQTQKDGNSQSKEDAGESTFEDTARDSEKISLRDIATVLKPQYSNEDQRKVCFSVQLK